MSEYQRYEFLTIDRPLTRAQLEQVNDLSSHIEASPTHAIVEYRWGDFKHDPIKVLHKYFDGFLYWANWGAPQLAFRFPHGVLPADLISHYDYDDYVTFTCHPDYDILDMHFGELEAPGEWIEYDLGSLIAIRDELLEGDRRALYIAWLACQHILGIDYDQEYDEDEGEDEQNDSRISVPAVPLGLATLTAAQQALVSLLQLPEDLVAVAAQHSKATGPSPTDNFVGWVELLPQDRRSDYLVRLANNEPGLSRLLVKELRALGLGPNRAVSPEGEQVTYATLLAESKAIRDQREREQREQARLAYLRRMQEVHAHQEDYWRRIDLAAVNKTSSSYDEAVRLLVELREVAEFYQESQAFQARFLSWVRPYLRRPALLERLQKHNFTVPKG